MMALFGGLALTVPMLIMALHPTQLTTLLTASIFVLVVAMLLAALMDSAESKDVVTATAGVCDEVPMLRRANEQRQYAAVLVVCVGASRITNNDSSLSRGVIAGIVVGCIAGILSLFLTCGLVLYLKWPLDSLLAIFGLGGREARRLTRKNTSNGIISTLQNGKSVGLGQPPLLTTPLRVATMTKTKDQHQAK